MNTASSLELLESRIAPAARTAKLLAGVLTISGDPVAGMAGHLHALFAS